MLATIIISVILAVLIAAIIRNMYKKKKQGKGSCSCGCSNCAMSDMCHVDEKKDL